MHRTRVWIGGMVGALILMAFAPTARPSIAVTEATVRDGPLLRPAAATAAASPTSAAQLERVRPPLSLTLMLLFTGCSVGAVIGVLILGFVAGRQGRRARGIAGQPDKKDRGSD